jgi:predicted HTH domain antitoxin
MSNESISIKHLPDSGLVSLRDLSEYFGIRLDRMQAKLKNARISTTDLSRNSRFRFVNLAEFAKSDLKLAPYVPLKGFRKKGTADLKDSPVPEKEAQMTLQEMKERIVFLTGNPDEDKRLRGELMNSDCFGKMYGADDCCQNCTRPVDLDGTKGPLKVFCQAISPEPVETKAA